MNGWLKMLNAVACVAIIGASGVYAYDRFSGHQPAASLTPSPWKIAQCEKDVTGMILKPPSDSITEGYGRGSAITLTDCEDYGLVSPTQKTVILRSGLAPYIKAYQENRDVWVRYKAQ